MGILCIFLCRWSDCVWVDLLPSTPFGSQAPMGSTPYGSWISLASGRGDLRAHHSKERPSLLDCATSLGRWHCLLLVRYAGEWSRRFAPIHHRAIRFATCHPPAPGTVPSALHTQWRFGGLARNLCARKGFRARGPPHFHLGWNRQRPHAQVPHSRRVRLVGPS